jgi:large subunit ribosomal protein L17
MRHRKKFNHLSRTSAHRKAMLSNMASSLIIHKRIKTTVAKAKALRMYVEPLINKSKTDNTHSRRIVFSHLQNKEAVSELFREISEKVANRPGGYTRILKLGNRQGDAAEVCYIELVDYNENMLSETSGAAKKSTRRSRRGGKKSTAETAAPVAEAAEKAPESAKEEPKADDAAEEKKEE